MIRTKKSRIIYDKNCDICSFSIFLKPILIIKLSFSISFKKILIVSFFSNIFNCIINLSKIIRAVYAKSIFQKILSGLGYWQIPKRKIKIG